jgi:hypothetical protein
VRDSEARLENERKGGRRLHVSALTNGGIFLDKDLHLYTGTLLTYTHSLQTESNKTRSTEAGGAQLRRKQGLLEGM